MTNFINATDAIKSFSTNQTRPSASEDYSDGNSLAARIVNGIIISILFKLGIATNIILLHVLRRRRGILLKNTRAILINLMIADLICCLVVLPSDFAFYVLQSSFSRAEEVFKLCFVLKTVTIFLNCSFTIALSIERFFTVTYVGKRRGNHFSRSMLLYLSAIWLSSLGDATITHYTVKDRFQLPWKLSGLATSSSSRCPPAGTFIAVFLVLAATFTILFSLHRIRSFLRVVKQDAVNEQLDVFSKRLARMHKRVNLFFLASLGTLIVSYLPMVTSSLLWYIFAWQSSDFNAIAEVFCSMAHTINPLIAVAMSRRLQSAFLRVLYSLCQSKGLRRRNPSLFGTLSNSSFRTAREINRIAGNNFQDYPQCNSPVFSKSHDENSLDDIEKNVENVNSFGGSDTRDESKIIYRIRKKRLTKQYSTPLGTALRTHHSLKKTFSGPPGAARVRSKTVM